MPHHRGPPPADTAIRTAPGNRSGYDRAHDSMTGEEKADFKELRAEMRDGFASLTASMERVVSRVDSLESTRDVQKGAEEFRERQMARGRADFQWRMAFVISLVTILVNIGLRLTGVI